MMSRFWFSLLLVIFSVIIASDSDAQTIYKKAPWSVTGSAKSGACNLTAKQGNVELYFTAMPNGVMVVVEGSKFDFDDHKELFQVLVPGTKIRQRWRDADYISIAVIATGSTRSTLAFLEQAAGSGVGRLQLADGSGRLLAEIKTPGMSAAVAAWSKCVATL
jgi:hypothetical protein